MKNTRVKLSNQEVSLIGFYNGDLVIITEKGKQFHIQEELFNDFLQERAEMLQQAREEENE